MDIKLTAEKVWVKCNICDFSSNNHANPESKNVIDDCNNGIQRCHECDYFECGDNLLRDKLVCVNCGAIFVANINI